MQPLLQWKSRVYYSTWACVFVAFRYLACNAHAPYRHLLPAALQNVSTLYSKQNDFRKKVTEHKKCVLIFYTTFVWNVSHATKKWARYDKIYVGLHVEYLLFLSDFNENLNFPDRFSKILKYQISWKSVQWEPSCSMGTDERTDGQTWRIQYAPSQYCESARKYKLSVYISDAITRFCWTNVVNCKTYELRTWMSNIFYISLHFQFTTFSAIKIFCQSRVINQEVSAKTKVCLPGCEMSDIFVQRSP